MVERIAAFEGDPSEPIAGTKYRVNKLVADRVNKLIADAPPEIQGDLRHAITSGYRTYEQQTKAYLHHLAGGGLAAPPGHSWHERLNGMAVDWNNMTPRAWKYLNDPVGPNGESRIHTYKMGFPLGSRDPYHSQPIETYAGGVNQVAAMRAGGKPSAATPAPLAYDDIFPKASPPLPVTPINPVPAPSQVSSTQEPHQIITKPMPLPTDEPFRKIVGSRGSVHQPNLGGAFREAINTILRTR